MLRINNYRVAKYMRLSRDDGDDRESESIENQRDIITNYIAEREDLIDTEEYIDDGYTGTNFNRPGFQKLLKDIQDGKINCIITKDLSRFGRDHIDTGYYLERFLPAHSIRYIAIGDSVDTLNPDGLQFLTFKLSFNDYYAQDISNKIRSVKQRKIEKGEFQGNTPPYGYKKDPNKKNHLIIDEYAANIVRTIFDQFVNLGMNKSQIAKKLNDENIEAPGTYLKMGICLSKPSSNPNGYQWSIGTITKLLQNEVYLGYVVGRKYRKVSHKVDKVVKLDRKENIIVKNMHEPIIDELLWEKAQDKMKRVGRVRNSHDKDILKEYVYCAECGGKALIRHKTAVRKNGNVWNNVTYTCSLRNAHRNNCKCKPINGEYLKEQVEETIRNEIRKINYSDKDIDQIYNQAKAESEKGIQNLKARKEELRIKIEEKKSMMSEIYSDKINKIISNEDFEMFYRQMENEKNKFQNEIKEIDDDIEKISKNSSDISSNIERIKLARDILDMKKINEKVYAMLVKKIEFDSNKTITITFSFGNSVVIKNKGGKINGKV